MKINLKTIKMWIYLLLIVFLKLLSCVSFVEFSSDLRGTRVLYPFSFFVTFRMITSSCVTGPIVWHSSTPIILGSLKKVFSSLFDLISSLLSFSFLFGLNILRIIFLSNIALVYIHQIWCRRLYSVRIRYNESLVCNLIFFPINLWTWAIGTLMLSGARNPL